MLYWFLLYLLESSYITVHMFKWAIVYYFVDYWTREYGRSVDLIHTVYRAADAVYAQDLCGESFQCQYDYFLSLNRELAFTTLQYQTVYSQIRSTVSETGNDTFLQVLFRYFLFYLKVDKPVLPVLPVSRSEWPVRRTNRQNKEVKWCSDGQNESRSARHRPLMLFVLL